MYPKALLLLLAFMFSLVVIAAPVPAANPDAAAAPIPSVLVERDLAAPMLKEKKHVALEGRAPSPQDSEEASWGCKFPLREGIFRS